MEIESVKAPAEPWRKYAHVINLGFQNTLVYRFNFFSRSLFGLIPLLATIYVWRAIYSANEAGFTVADYSLAGMTSYYLLVTLVDMLTAVNEDDWQIAADIKDGNISQFLLKPIDYLTYRFCLYAAGRLIYTTVALAPVAVFIFAEREFFVFPVSGAALAWFLVSLALTAVLQFLMSFTMALLAFWVLEVSTFIFIVFAFEYIAGGHLFPLDILPDLVERLLALTPFPYLMFFPVSIYLGRVSGAAMWQGLAIQAFWVVAYYAIARFVWSRGVRHYTAVGG